MHTPVAPANYNISLDKQILCLELSPYELSSNLFCAALINKIVIGTIQFPVRKHFTLKSTVIDKQIKNQIFNYYYFAGRK